MEKVIINSNNKNNNKKDNSDIDDIKIEEQSTDDLSQLLSSQVQDVMKEDLSYFDSKEFTNSIIEEAERDEQYMSIINQEDIIEDEGRKKMSAMKKGIIAV